MLSPKDLQRHQRASGIVPTSATYSQCHSVLDSRGYHEKRIQDLLLPPWAELSHGLAFLAWADMGGEYLILKVTKGG